MALIGHLPPTSWVCLFVGVLVHCCRECYSVDFRLVSALRPLEVVAGKDVILPCSVDPAASAEDFDVDWFTLSHREGTNRIHSYSQGRDQNDVQNPSYRGRTALFHSELRHGNISLKLRNVQPSDTRDYICFTTSSYGKHYAMAKLSVRAKGTKPEISVDVCEDIVCRLVCKSSGWSPKPTIDWLDGKKRKLRADVLVETWEDEGFTVQRRLQVETGFNDTYFCRVSERNHVEMTEIKI